VRAEYSPLNGATQPIRVSRESYQRILKAEYPFNGAPARATGELHSVNDLANRSRVARGLPPHRFDVVMQRREARP
jgi:hypothetical protein